MTVTYDWATDRTTVVTNLATELVYPVGTSFVVITTMLSAPEKGSAGIKIRDAAQAMYYSVGPFNGPTVINSPAGMNFLAIEWNNVHQTFMPYCSEDGETWELCPMPPDVDGNPMPYPTFAAPTHAGLFFQPGDDALFQDTTVFGAPRVLPGTLFLTIGDGTYVISHEEEMLEPIGAIPVSPPDPLTPSEEAVVHALVGAPFGDLEFDVGKSVGWLQRFVDDIFVTDINRGDQRYWVVNWTATFAHTYYKFSSLNYFTDPEAYRKGQVTDAFTYATNYPTKLVYDDNDWVIFLDAHEGLSADNRSFPDDFLIEPYKSFVYREIARANKAGLDRIVLPFFVFLRHDHIQNVSQSYTFEDTTFTSTQSVGVPYYEPVKGLTRMFKVSALKAPNFDWSILDTPVSLPEATTGNPPYLNPTVGTVSVPDPVTLPAQFCWVWKTQGPTGAAASVHTLAGQWRNTPGTQRSWLLTTDPGGYLGLESSNNGTNTGTFGGKMLPLGTQTVAFSVNKTTGDQEVFVLGDSGWESVLDMPGFGQPKVLFDSTLPVIIGQNAEGTNKFNGRIYWMECRSGLDPAAGTVLWRFDASEYPGTGTSYVDPRGKTWTLTNASAVSPATPGVKLQIVSYAYAHWHLLDVPAGQITVPPLTAENDDGWKQRCAMTQVLPVPGLPTGSATDPVGTWKDPSLDPPGKRGPWAPENYALKIDDPVIPDPPPPIAAEVAGVRVPMYDLVFRINVRDGVWYAAGGTGNTQLVWDDTLEEFVPYVPPAA